MLGITKHRVHFYDTDSMQVTHHANYIKWFEIGRVEFLRKLGITLDELMCDGILFPITEINCKFFSPSRFDDVLIIETYPTALTKVKVAFDYKVLREKDATLLVTGHTQSLFTDKKTGRILRLPKKYEERLIKGLLD